MHCAPYYTTPSRRFWCTCTCTRVVHTRIRTDCMYIVYICVYGQQCMRSGTHFFTFSHSSMHLHDSKTSFWNVSCRKKVHGPCIRRRSQYRSRHTFFGIGQWSWHQWAAIKTLFKKRGSSISPWKKTHRTRSGGFQETWERYIDGLLVLYLRELMVSAWSCISYMCRWDS